MRIPQYAPQSQFQSMLHSTGVLHIEADHKVWGECASARPFVRSDSESQIVGHGVHLENALFRFAAMPVCR
jgi:hypothetical protein